MQLNYGQEEFIMHPSGCLYWPSQNTVLIADVHFGKVDHFRKNGSALPGRVGLENFRKLNQILEEFQPEEILFLGDLFHSTQNKDWDRFTAWVHLQTIKMTLIVGNHDIIPSYRFEDLGIKVVPEIKHKALYLTHHPEEKEGFYNICGHLHPGYKLRGAGRQQLKLSCFYRKRQQLVLPAFGAFTGHFLIEPEVDEDVFVLSEDLVLSIR
ncbi:ligase-associated DNA damage response endonuclease PdeM [Psychroflexus sp. YR1-1]|uniref:Ligase-associated DNA damage response endonuclease PdeM n=1 Tax=Psychroflexus aurantiacus TaxID=2709310 RepID=A0A6B3R4R1_9FLAO|nr:ligase-associated DNA damage response endonuclease PdeM [Psychroflexus aurantiacus]NEV92871.1 ligase-associated DNA damage response endonuclease PdeM [Psychroflexus aurantiacus]